MCIVCLLLTERIDGCCYPKDIWLLSSCWWKFWRGPWYCWENFRSLRIPASSRGSVSFDWLLFPTWCNTWQEWNLQCCSFYRKKQGSICVDIQECYWRLLVEKLCPNITCRQTGEGCTSRAYHTTMSSWLWGDTNGARSIGASALWRWCRVLDTAKPMCLKLTCKWKILQASMISGDIVQVFIMETLIVMSYAWSFIIKLIE